MGARGRRVNYAALAATSFSMRAGTASPARLTYTMTVGTSHELLNAPPTPSDVRLTSKHDVDLRQNTLGKAPGDHGCWCRRFPPAHPLTTLVGTLTTLKGPGSRIGWARLLRSPYLRDSAVDSVFLARHE